MLREAVQELDELFRVSFGGQRTPEVEAWFDARPGELGRLAREWFCHMRDAGDDVLELIHDGCPVASIEDVPFVVIGKSVSIADQLIAYATTSEAGAATC